MDGDTATDAVNRMQIIQEIRSPIFWVAGPVVLVSRRDRLCSRSVIGCRATNGPPQAPTSFYCPVSMELMSDPVMVATGHTYDRVCIERWLQQGNRTCPVTGMRLRHLELTPNHALRNAIQVLHARWAQFTPCTFVATCAPRWLWMLPVPATPCVWKCRHYLETLRPCR